MNKKLDIKLTILIAFNFLICLFLIIFKAPNSVPLFFSTKETISVLGSKWWLLTSVILPTIIGIMSFIFYKKQNLNFVLKMLFYVCLYENMLIMIYVSATDTFVLNMKSEIPLSLIYFLPISACIMIGALKLKTLPYKSFSPFKNKFSCQTEFIWKQTHIFAKDITFAFGFILVIISMIMAIFRLFWINLIVMAVAILTIYFLTLREAVLMCKKNTQMQNKKDNLSKKQNETK